MFEMSFTYSMLIQFDVLFFIFALSVARVKWEAIVLIWMWNGPVVFLFIKRKSHSRWAGTGRMSAKYVAITISDIVYHVSIDFIFYSHFVTTLFYNSLWQFLYSPIIIITVRMTFVNKNLFYWLYLFKNKTFFFYLY